MYSSPVFKTSAFCASSPNGLFLAVIQQNRAIVREIKTLHVIHEIVLPADAISTIFTLLWAPSSTKILVASGDRLLVYSAFDTLFKATVKNPASSSSKPTHVQFGPTDTEVLAFSHFGLKLALINLSTSSAIELANPKFHQPVAAARSVSFRPGSHHMALLTRVGGKDTISIHPSGARTVERSFHPETIDAQGVAWASKGRWLIVWESPAQGHKLLLYTPDGHLFHMWTGPPDTGAEAQHYELGAGIKHCHMDRATLKAALCDYTRAITMLDLTVGSQMTRLVHPTTVIPLDTLQIWQEERALESPDDQSIFVRATQAFSPPERSAAVVGGPEIIPGCFLSQFDCSSSLLATVIEDYRSTLWIWDLNSTADLRAVIMFHGSIVGISWHPKTPELLLISCAAEDGITNAIYTWDPLSEGPRAVPFAVAQAQAPKPGKVPAKIKANWVAELTEPPVALLTDGTNGVMVAVSEGRDDGEGEGVGGDGLWGNAGLAAKVLHGAAATTVKVVDAGEISFADDDEETTRIDDTFEFKNKRK